MEEWLNLHTLLSGAFICLSGPDGENLKTVLPSEHAIDSQYSFFLYATELFQTISIGHAVRFSKLAIQAAPANFDIAPLWNTVVKGSMELALYDEAYAAVISMPYEKQYVSILSTTFFANSPPLGNESVLAN